MSERYEKGLEIRTAVLGPDYVGPSLENAGEFMGPIQQLATEYSWGTVWARSGLSRKWRSLITLAMYSGQNRSHALKIHVRGALRNGATMEEIQDVFMLSAVHFGMGAAMDSFRWAQEVIDEEKAKAEG